MVFSQGWLCYDCAADMKCQDEGKTMPPDTVWFIFHNSSLLLRREPDGASALPVGKAPPVPPAGALHRLGLYRDLPCMAYATLQTPDPEEWDSPDLRAAYGLIAPGLHPLANKAFELIHWDRQSQYCSACGVSTQPATAISKRCPACGRTIFPTLTPAVLVLVRQRDSILLVHARAFKGPFYSILAGYLEPGENLEECVRREVLEETGITVGNVTYFGSQCWPFPSNLMAGFIADYASGELKLQENELESGAFYTRDNLPQLPGPFSLSRRMIDWWREQG
jgi:NAD+ diphosphatase